MPFKTATPNKAIKPMPAEMLNGISRSSNANTPPIADIGMAVKINAAYFSELKVKNSKPKMRNNETGTAMLNLLEACARFSKVPPYVK